MRERERERIAQTCVIVSFGITSSVSQGNVNAKLSLPLIFWLVVPLFHLCARPTYPTLDSARNPRVGLLFPSLNY